LEIEEEKLTVKEPFAVLVVLPVLEDLWVW